MSKTFGLIATFGNTHNLYKAAEEICEAGFRHWDVYSPFPVHGLEGAMGLERSKVPAFTLIGGVTGFITGMFIAWYMGEFDFPLVVGGKPLFSPIFPFPVAYEMTILLASFGAFRLRHGRPFGRCARSLLSSTTPRSSRRKPHWARHLTGLATKLGEKWGLAVQRSSRCFRRA